MRWPLGESVLHRIRPISSAGGSAGFLLINIDGKKEKAAEKIR